MFKKRSYSRKRKKSIKHKGKSEFLRNAIILAVLMGALLGIVRIDNLVRPKRSAAITRPVLRSTPTTIPSPTPTPTPSPVPLVGYCLKVPVLMYHHVQPQNQAVEKKQTDYSVDNGMFDQQIQYLVSQGYTFLTAKELVNALVSKSAVPSKSIVVTLDDGYLDNYQYAYPVFKKYGVKGNFMIATGLLGGADYMSWENIREMAGSGLAYFTDHTWSHYAVGYGTADKIKYEITTAKQQLQDNLGQAVDIFAYPYGSFSDLSINILKQEGFSGAFSTIFGDVQCDSFIMALHRRRIGNSPLPNYGL